MKKILGRVVLTVLMVGVGFLLGVGYMVFGNMSPEVTESVDIAELGQLDEYYPGTTIEVVLWYVTGGESKKVDVLYASPSRSEAYVGPPLRPGEPHKRTSKYFLATQWFPDSTLRWTVSVTGLLPGSTRIIQRRYPFFTVRRTFTPFVPFPHRAVPPVSPGRIYILYAQGDYEFSASSETALSHFESLSASTSSHYLVATIE